MLKKIIIVDDEVEITKLIQMYLDQKKNDDGSPRFEVKTFFGGNPCIEYLKLDGYADLILSDMRMPNGEGVDILNYLSKSNKDIPLFFMTGFSGDINVDDVLQNGAKRVYAKPFKCRDLVAEIETFLKVA